MKEQLKTEIEEYIKEWFWDDDSHEFAFELGKYLFEFMDNLQQNSGLSYKSRYKHETNIWCIGMLICQYGCHSKFTPKIFSYPPYQNIEFKRKFSDSKYQIQSYNSTCNRLKKYSIEKGDLSFEKELKS